MKTLKTNLEAALTAHRTATTPEAVAASNEAIKTARAALSAHLTQGAHPCPTCKLAPLGIEQPLGKGRVEYEIGCVAGCVPFVHTDGTMRAPRVRGGLLPQHAVDAWNAGPDHWSVVPTPGAETLPAPPDTEAS